MRHCTFLMALGILVLAGSAIAGCSGKQDFPEAGRPGSLRNLPAGTGAAKYFEAQKAAGHTGERPPGGWRKGQ